jgi:hypothetical protein
MFFGMPEIIILLVLTGLGLVPILAGILLWRIRRRARRFGYASAMEYLRATPKSDEERRDAADLAVIGLVVCMFGIFWAPFVLAGLFPFFYGARKFAYATLGLGLVDDGEEPGL